MMNRSKVFCFKLLFCATIMVFTVSGVASAEEEKKKTMKSVAFSPSTQEETKEDEKNPKNIEEADADEGIDVDENGDAKEQSAEQKLWDKYKAMKAESTEQFENIDDDNDNKTQDSEPALTDKEKEEQAKNEKKANGLRGIVEAYKNSQKNKGTLNSRSFGNID